MKLYLFGENFKKQTFKKVKNIQLSNEMKNKIISSSKSLLFLNSVYIPLKFFHIDMYDIVASSR